MLPIGPLMKEHRLIERFVDVVKKECSKIIEQNDVDRGFIRSAVDFFRTYADKCHHGKEEDILFKELESKELTEHDQKMIDELVQDHIYARKTVTKLAEAGNNYIKGDTENLKQIVSLLNELAQLYPAHIEKEDKQFFYPSMNYFTKTELGNMREQFWEFDRKIIHIQYEKFVSEKEEKTISKQSQNQSGEKWECTVCGYIYNPETGDSEHGIKPGTRFESLPDKWVCPVCFAKKEAFKKI